MEIIDLNNRVNLLEYHDTRRHCERCLNNIKDKLKKHNLYLHLNDDDRWDITDEPF